LTERSKTLFGGGNCNLFGRRGGEKGKFEKKKTEKINQWHDDPESHLSS